MKEFKIDNTGSGTLFQNPLLEKLTRTHFAFPVILYFVIGFLSMMCGFLYSDASWISLFYLFPTGMLFFSLVEYLIHRFLFHFNAETESEKKLQYTIHGVHHEFPKDKDRLVMPPLVSIFLAAFFFVLFILTIGNNTWFFYSGFVSGYSIYLLIHFAVHRYRPPRNFFRIFWKHHALHHYKSTDGYYSVSFPLWDYLFRTIKQGTDDRALASRLPDMH